MISQAVVMKLLVLFGLLGFVSNVIVYHWGRRDGRRAAAAEQVGHGADPQPQVHQPLAPPPSHADNHWQQL